MVQLLGGRPNSNNKIDRNSGIIRIDESDPQIFHYFVAIINKGIIKTKEENLSFNDIVFNTLPRAMFILMPFMGVLLLLLYNKKKNILFISFYCSFTFPLFCVFCIFNWGINSICWSGIASLFFILFIIYAKKNLSRFLDENFN